MVRKTLLHHKKAHKGGLIAYDKDKRIRLSFCRRTAFKKATGGRYVR
ncbi:MAG: hypothetical protein WDA02_02550 [Saccharofermentanales bacterium]